MTDKAGKQSKHGEEFVTFYDAHFEDADKTAYGIMQEWCDAIANGEDDD